ncbi:MAG: tRNA pseudouridine(55) synthase TruB [Candidatus Paceibacteria bacterium]
MKGLLLVDKPSGPTSHDLVEFVADKEGIEKAGHIGTLDPLAEGLLGILINKATKVSQYLVGLDKKYIVELEFGKETDTLDISGEVVRTCELGSVDAGTIEKKLNQFLGKIKQKPPKYSAIKKEGKKLYEYAENDKQVEIEPRDVEIYEADLLEFGSQENKAKIELHCSSGTYTRSLVRDLGRALDSCAVQTGLKRTRIGEFGLSDAYSKDEIRQMNSDEFAQALVNLNEALSFYPQAVIKPQAERFAKNGTPLRVKNFKQLPENISENETTQIVDKEGNLLALGEFSEDSQDIDTRNPEREMFEFETVLETS